MRSDSDLAFFAPNSLTSFAHSSRAGPQLGDLHEEVHADAPRRTTAAARTRRRPARRPGRPQVLHAVGERVGQLQVGRRPGLLDVVAGDGDRVEPRHLLRGEREDVADDPHRRLRRVDVGVADHELLEDVVLDGPGQLLRRHPLLLGRDDVERQHRQHGAVHRHRHAHPVQRDAVEQLPHVVDRVDRDARPCRRRRPPAGGRSRSRGGWAGRRRPTGPSARRRGCAGRRRWTPRRWRSPAYWRIVHGWVAYIVGYGPAQVRRDARVGVQEVQARRGRRRCTAAGRRCPPASPRSPRSTPRPVASLNALRPVVGRGARRRAAQLDGAEVGDRAHRCTPSCVVHGAEDGERVAAGEDVAVDAVDRQVRLAGQPHLRGAGRPQLRGQPRRRSARRPCRCRRGRRPSSPPSAKPVGAVAGRRLEAAGLEQVAGEAGAGGVRGDRPERGQEDRRPAARRRRPRSRSSSNACARAHPRQPAGRRRPARGLARTGSFSARFGNSLTPVIGVAAVRQPLRRARPRRRRSGRATSPESSAAARPPARSISVNQSQAACGELVGERLDVPGAAGRVEHPGQVRLLDQQRSGCCGRSGGRRRRAGPSAASNGSTVTASAPPTPAAKQATVVRSMFTHGSRCVIITDEVTACCRWPRASGDAPLTSPTRSHSRRAARSLAMVGNWSAVARVAELQLRRTPRRRSARPR